MEESKGLDPRVGRLIDAFNADGYDVDPGRDIYYYKPDETGSYRVGIRATHKTACINGNRKKKKKVFYLEGTPYQMGYMMGYLAEPDVSLMAVEYVENFAWSFIKYGQQSRTYERGKWFRKLFKKAIKFSCSIIDHILRVFLPGYRELRKTLKKLWEKIENVIEKIVVNILFHFSEGIKQDIPKEYLDEMQGILDGCKAANPKTKVKLKNLFVLNVGIDCVMAYLYRGLQLLKEVPEIKPEHLEIPVMCNGFSVSGSAAAGGNHYMGRDFMFPTGDAFQDAACMTIYKPDMEGALPTIIVGGPGMVGAVAGINAKGVAVGVDVAPSGWADPERPGFNSLLLCRHSIQYGPDIHAAVEVMKKAHRGVPWIYILADGSTGKSCIVESVCSITEEIKKGFPHEELEKAHFLKADTREPETEETGIFSFADNVKEAIAYIKENHPDIGDSVVQNDGIEVRWAGDAYPGAYLDLDGELFRMFDRTLYPDALGDRGFFSKYIPKRGIELNTPYTFYFAPQRETNPDIVLTTNFFIDPDARYTAMNAWVGKLFDRQNNDYQWRYDTLNSLILDALERSEGGITYETAKDILAYLNPKGKYPWYYGKKDRVIEGTLSLFDLKAKTIESQYGYYRDEWISLTLPKYL